MKQEISKLLQKKKKNILEDWMHLQSTDAGLREDLMSNDELREQSVEMLEALLQGFSEKDNTDLHSEAFATVQEILSGISISRARQGFSPRETGVFVFSLKEAIIKTIVTELSHDQPTLIAAMTDVSKLLDNLGIATFETFIKGREEVILRQTDEIAEISTPVIQVWDGILALPIIGTLDSARTQVVMENLLQSIVDTGSTIAILDISGVPAVDSLVAQHIIKTVAATRLMGAECIISGIRPEIAQTVVHLGIDLSNIVTKASLANALKHAFAMLKLDVKRIQKVLEK
jgi:rsbT co-antagonist protein RsbR